MKLKNTVLCQLILYSPVIILFSFSFVLVALIGTGEEAGPWFTMLIILPMILALVYLFKNLTLFMVSDIVFSIIRSWKKARLWFETDINGTSRKVAEKKILSRCRRLSKKYDCDKHFIEPLSLHYRQKSSSSIHWAKIDKFVAVYSVDFLDEELYKEIIKSAKANFKTLHKPFKPTIFTDKRQKKAPNAKCCAVIILADSVSAYVIPKASKCTEDKQCGCIMPLVADFSTKRYYFDSMKEAFEPGLMGRPEKNYSIDVVKKYVFAGKLPLKNNNRMLDFELDGIDLEKSLWQFIKEFKQEGKQIEKSTRKLIEKLKDNEVCYKDEEVFFKLGERTASFLATWDEDNEEKIDVLLLNEWTYPKKSKISLKDMEIIKDRIETELTAKGYQVTFETDLLPKSYQKLFSKTN